MNQPAGRIQAVDIMRGLTMAAMIVVNNPGSWAHMWAPLRHANWGGILTPADFVFPFFLVLVGVSTPLALGRRVDRGEPRLPLLRRASQRALTLAAIGLFLNLFPQFDLATVRIPGVLQRIAVVALASAAAFLWLSPRGIGALLVGLLAGYTALLLLAPVPGVGSPLLIPEAHLPGWLDDRLFGAHTWRGPGDPEGVLSSLGAVATGLVGVLAGVALRGPGAVQRLGLGGALAAALGLAATPWLPAAKDVWTAAYALITGGAALLVLAGLLAVDRRTPAPLRDALATLGRQALLAYVLAHLASDVSIHLLRWSNGSWHTLVHGQLLRAGLPPVTASAGYSLLMLAGVWATVAWLDRRGVHLRV